MQKYKYTKTQKYIMPLPFKILKKIKGGYVFQQILDLLKKERGKRLYCVEDIEKILSANIHTVRGSLRKLVKSGKIKRIWYKGKYWYFV